MATSGRPPVCHNEGFFRPFTDQAAAVAIEMIERGELTAPGTDPASTGQRIMAATAAVIAQAKRIPEAARDLFLVILFGRTDCAAMVQTRKLLADIGIPAKFLSR